MNNNNMTLSTNLLDAPTSALLAITLVVPFLAILAYFTRWPGKQAKIKPLRASAFRKDLIPPKIDTVVIGSGSGGCACANLLAQSGQGEYLVSARQRIVLQLVHIICTKPPPFSLHCK